MPMWTALTGSLALRFLTGFSGGYGGRVKVESEVRLKICFPGFLPSESSSNGYGGLRSVLFCG